MASEIYKYFPEKTLSRSTLSHWLKTDTWNPCVEGRLTPGLKNEDCWEQKLQRGIAGVDRWQVLEEGKAYRTEMFRHISEGNPTDVLAGLLFASSKNRQTLSTHAAATTNLINVIISINLDFPHSVDGPNDNVLIYLPTSHGRRWSWNMV